MADATLVVKILTDYKDAASSTDAVGKKFGKFGSAMQKAALPAAAVVAGITAVGVAAVKSASRTQQAFGGVDAVFGKNAAQVKGWAAGAASSLGLAKSEYGEFATLIGSQLKNAGVPMDQLAGKTKGMIEQGADLAAMYGGTTADAVAALSSAMKGEFDPLERYGTSLSATKIAAEMAAQGSDKLTGKAQQQAKMLATLKLITDQTKDAQGAAGRESDTTAARMQQLGATVENLKSDLGEALLPVVAKLLGYLAKLAAWAQKNQAVVITLVAVLGGLALAVLAVNAAMWIMAANPIALIIGAIVLAVAALAVGFVMLYKRSQTFRKYAQAAFKAVATVTKAVAKTIAAVFRVAWAAASAYVRAYVAVVRAVLNVIRTVIGWVISAVQSLSRWFGRLKVPGAIRSALQAVRTAANWAIDKVKSLGTWLSKLKVPGVVKTVLDGIKGAVDRVIGAVKTLVGWISRIKIPRISLPKVGGRSAPAPSTARALPTVAALGGVGAPMVPMGRAVGAGAGAGGVNITVNGAVDPEGTARAIGRIMGAHQRRMGYAATSRGTRGLRVA